MSFTDNLVMLWLESAPWLLLGLLIAGLMKALIPQTWMQRQLGGKSRWNIVKAALIGAPLPLCSCGVVPAALGLRRAGASKGPTLSFLVATPETGPDSIALSYALLGPFMAIIRPIAAVFSAIVAGFMVSERQDIEPNQSHTHKSCCASNKKNISVNQTFTHRLFESMNYSFIKLLSDISLWLVIGIGVAALMKTYLPMHWLAEWGNGLSAMLVMAVIGVPMYICASASTPLAAGFLAMGISPGAILVFMLAGPATNIGTLGIIKKELGSQPLVAYLIGVILTALAFGLLTDYLVTHFELVVNITTHSMEHEHGNGSRIAGIVLLLLIVFSKIKAWWGSDKRLGSVS